MIQDQEITLEDQSSNTGRRKFSKALRIIVIILAIILAVFLLGSYLGRPYSKSDNTYKDVIIPEDASVSDIATILEDTEIIGSASNFELLSNCLFYSNKYKEGTYYLSPSMSMEEISKMMINGITTENGFELPSGYTVKQTAFALKQAGFVDSDKFIEIANTAQYFSSSFEFLSDATSLEGYLYPDTYAMEQSADEYMIITTMLNQFDNAFTSEYRQRASELGYSINDIVRIASVIEKATNIDDERSSISAVIHNRIKAGVSTESDFPATPLCSPGIASIKAALYPEENDNLYYSFNSNLDGSHVFTNSYDTYLINEQAYNEAHEKNK